MVDLRTGSTIHNWLIQSLPVSLDGPKHKLCPDVRQLSSPKRGSLGRGNRWLTESTEAEGGVPSARVRLHVLYRNNLGSTNPCLKFSFNQVCVVPCRCFVRVSPDFSPRCFIEVYRDCQVGAEIAHRCIRQSARPGDQAERQPLRFLLRT